MGRADGRPRVPDGRAASLRSAVAAVGTIAPPSRQALTRLHEQGLVTDAEFDDLRARLDD